MFSHLILVFSFCVGCVTSNKAAAASPTISSEQQTHEHRQRGECNQGADCIIFSFGSRSKPTKIKQTPADGARLAVLHEDAPVLRLKSQVRPDQVSLI